MSANSDDSNNNNRAPRRRKKKAAMNRDSSEEEEESDASGGVARAAPVVKQERMGQENEDDEADAGVGSSYQYRDCSRDVASNLKTEDGEDDSTELPHSSMQSFPVKLHRILSNPEYQEIVCWLPHGRAWRILQLKAFEDKVLPLYFRHGRHASFARQVNGWGFRRITSGPDYNAYFHELFLRGFPKLCKRMKRLTSKDIANRHQEDPPPDFYALSRDHPLPELPERGSPPAAPPAEPAAALGGSGLGQPMGIHHASSIVAAAPAAAAGDDVLQRDALKTRRCEIVQRLENLLNCTQGEALLAAVGLAARGGPLAAAALPPAMTISTLSNPSSGWGSLAAQNPSSLSNVAPTPEAQTLALINSLLQQTNAAAKPAPTFPAPAPAASAVPCISDVLALIGRTASAPSTTVAAAQQPPPPAASNPADMLGILQRLMAGSQATVSAAPQPGFQLQQAPQLGQQGASALISPLQGQFQLQQALQRGQGGQQGDLLRYLQNQALGGTASGFFQAQAPSTTLAPNPFGFAFGQQQAPYGFVTSQASSLVGYPSMDAASSGVAETTGNININQILNLMQQQQGNQQQQQNQHHHQQQQQQTLQRQHEKQKQEKQEEEERQQQDDEEEEEKDEDEQQKPPAVTSKSSTGVLQAPSQPNDMVTALSGLDPAQTAALLQQLQGQMLGNNRPGNVLSPPPSATTATSTTTSSDSDIQGNRPHPLAALGFLVDGNGGTGISGGGAAFGGGGDANSNLILSILAAMNSMQQNK